MKMLIYAVLRIDSRVVEILEKENDVNDNVKKSLLEIGNVSEETKEIKAAVTHKM